MTKVMNPPGHPTHGKWQLISKVASNNTNGGGQKAEPRAIIEVEPSGSNWSWQELFLIPIDLVYNDGTLPSEWNQGDKHLLRSHSISWLHFVPQCMVTTWQSPCITEIDITPFMAHRMNRREYLISTKAALFQNNVWNCRAKISYLTVRLLTNPKAWKVDRNKLTPRGTNWHHEEQTDTTRNKLPPCGTNWHHVEQTATTTWCQRDGRWTGTNWHHEEQTDTTRNKLTPRGTNWHHEEQTDTTRNKLTPRGTNWHHEEQTDTTTWCQRDGRWTGTNWHHDVMSEICLILVELTVWYQSTSPHSPLPPSIPSNVINWFSVNYKCTPRSEILLTATNAERVSSRSIDWEPSAVAPPPPPPRDDKLNSLYTLN